MPITGEAAFVNAMPGLIQQAYDDTHEPGRTRTVYARLFGTEVGYRLDLGLTLLADDDEPDASVVRRAMKLKFAICGSGERNEFFTLKSQQFDVMLRYGLIRRTEPHGATDAASLRASALMIGTRLVVVERPNRASPSTLSVQRKPRGGGAYGLPTGFPLWELWLDPDNREEARRLRAAIWRLHFEKEVLHQLFALAQDERLRTRYNVDIELLCHQLDIHVTRLAKISYAGFNQPALIALAQQADGFNDMFRDLPDICEQAQRAALRLEKIRDSVRDAERVLDDFADYELLSDYSGRYTIDPKAIRTGQSLQLHGRVFISHDSQDSQVVDRLIEYFKAEKLTLVRGRTDIPPGRRWKTDIRRAISTRLAFVACFSRHSMSREKSNMNEELILAIDEIRARHGDRSWFFPVRLDDCAIPDRSIGGNETLHDIQPIDLFPDFETNARRLVSAIRDAIDIDLTGDNN